MSEILLYIWDINKRMLSLDPERELEQPVHLPQFDASFLLCDFVASHHTLEKWQMKTASDVCVLVDTLSLTKECDLKAELVNCQEFNLVIKVVFC
jgi:hypothetical protein